MNFSWLEQITNHIKIPTILALLLLTVGLVGGVYLSTQKEFLSLKTQADVSTAPKNVAVGNLSDTSAVIFWQTDKPTSGFVQIGQTQNLGQNFQDDRDNKIPLQHNLHFVTLSNLSPATTYYYKITSGGESFPDNNSASFTTLNSIPYQTYSPLVGRVLNSDLQPVQEALIVLEIPGAQPLNTITKLAGNYILPLSNLRSSDLLHVFTLGKGGTTAKLRIFDNERSSEVKIYLDSQGNQITSTASALMPIIIGKDLDLIPPSPTPTPTLSPLIKDLVKQKR